MAMENKEMAMEVIGGGSVDGNGENQRAGGNWQYERIDVGEYYIKYNSPFPTIPAFVATLVVQGRVQRDNIINIDPRREGCFVYIFDLPGGAPQDGVFSFLFYGLR